MICEAPGCQAGYMAVLVDTPTGKKILPGHFRPCDRCHGTGFQHCCEGEQEQPAAPANTEEDAA